MSGFGVVSLMGGDRDRGYADRGQTTNVTEAEGQRSADNSR
jgi:hypothetical protein